MESELSVKVSSQGARFELILYLQKNLLEQVLKFLVLALIFSFYAWLQGTHYILRLYIFFNYTC